MAAQPFNSTTFIVDDASPLIKYSGPWTLDNPSSAEYNLTKTGTTEAGASATFTFAGE